MAMKHKKEIRRVPITEEQALRFESTMTALDGKFLADFLIDLMEKAERRKVLAWAECKSIAGVDRSDPKTNVYISWVTQEIVVYEEEEADALRKGGES